MTTTLLATSQQVDGDTFFWAALVFFGCMGFAGIFR